MIERLRLDLYLNTPELGIIHAGDVVIIEKDQTLTQVGFRYQSEYLQHPAAFPVDPVQLPLSSSEFTFHCHAAAPAFLDDYLPDAWGRKVLACLALYRDQRKLNSNSLIQIFSMLSHSRIGAICLVPPGTAPAYELGNPINALSEAETAAQHIDQLEFDDVATEQMNLLYLANSGTGVGGARPKALLHDDNGAYLAKFNRQHLDRYNNARVELACLTMAQAAGLDVGKGKIAAGINQREALLLERFDITGQARHHLNTVNGLLKDPASQRDNGKAFRYDDICSLIQRHSCQVEKDLQQLLRLMLFNRAINNTDDHERNFSLIHRGEGYQLSPAYDLVPSLAQGEYHAAGYQYQPDPPRPSEAHHLGRIWGLPKPQVRHIADQVIHAVNQWQQHAEQAGVREKDMQQIQAVLQV
ncbi:MAG: type II toxin-antitoxin system HipA family toxin [Pseudomonadales bacterium]|nr:type II toxin-antitoxin system HipA family toxin [Pseudomonadales bacterium]